MNGFVRRQAASWLYESQATRDARAPVKANRIRLEKRLRPKAGWGVPLAWVTLCVVWSSTWLAIKIGLRDLPPISFVAIRFLVAIVVLLAVSIRRTRLLPRGRNDYVVLAITGILMFAVNYTLLIWAELHVSSVLAAVLQVTIPIFGMILAHWRRTDEPLRLRRLHWTSTSVFCLLYLAVIGSALTFLLLYWLLPRLTVAQLQSISLITPPGAVMLGWLLGGETFPPSSLLGAGLVLAGVWIIFRKAAASEPLIQEG